MEWKCRKEMSEIKNNAGSPLEISLDLLISYYFFRAPLRMFA